MIDVPISEAKEGVSTLSFGINVGFYVTICTDEKEDWERLTTDPKHLEAVIMANLADYVRRIMCGDGCCIDMSYANIKLAAAELLPGHDPEGVERVKQLYPK